MYNTISNFFQKILQPFT